MKNKLISILLIMSLIITGTSIVSAKNYKTRSNEEEITVSIYADYDASANEEYDYLRNAEVILKKEGIEVGTFEYLSDFELDTNGEGIGDRPFCIYLLNIEVDKDVVYTITATAEGFNEITKTLSGENYDAAFYLEIFDVKEIYLLADSDKDEGEEEYVFIRDAEIEVQKKDGLTIIETYNFDYIKDGGVDVDSDAVGDSCVYSSAFNIDDSGDYSYRLSVSVDGYNSYSQNLTSQDSFPLIVTIEKKSQSKENNNLIKDILYRILNRPIFEFLNNIFDICQ